MKLRRKIINILGFIAIIPFLVTCYLVTYVPSSMVQTRNIIVFLTALSIILGSMVLLNLTRTITKLYSSLNTMARGDIHQQIQTRISTDTAGMTMSINQISHNLKESANELEKRAILLERFNQEIEKRNGLRTAYFSNAAHELRAPLINIDKCSAAFKVINR